MLTLRVFVGSDPPSGDDARALNAVRAAAARFGDEVAVEVVPSTSVEGRALGVAVTPTVVDADMVLSVGPQLSAGRLLRYLRSRLDTPDAAGPTGQG